MTDDFFLSPEDSAKWVALNSQLHSTNTLIVHYSEALKVFHYSALVLQNQMNAIVEAYKSKAKPNLRVIDLHKT